MIAPCSEHFLAKLSSITNCQQSLSFCVSISFLSKPVSLTPAAGVISEFQIIMSILTMSSSGKKSTTFLLNYQQLFIVLSLLIVFALVIFVWMIPAYRHDNRSEQIIDSSLPDAFGEQVISKKYNDAGLLVNKLQAATIEHYPFDGITWLTLPRLWGYGEANKINWHATSEKGKMFPDHKTFELLDNVVVTQSGQSGKAEVRVNTNKMTVYTNRHLAKTDEPVKITEPGRVVHTVGMTYDYKSNVVELKSHVRGVGMPGP